MSSFPDSDVRTSVGVPTGSTAPEDVLARVKADGLRRRTRRHRRNSALAVVGLAIVAVPAIALLPGDDGNDDVTVAAESDNRPTPTTSRRPTRTTIAPTTATTATTLPTVTTIIIDGDEVGLIPPTSVVRRPTPTTVPATTVPPTTAPPPSNEPISTSLQRPALNQNGEPETIPVGQPYTMTIQWSDADASVVVLSNPSLEGVGLGRACTETSEPPTPQPSPGGGTLDFTHTFETAGTYTVTWSVATASTGENACSDPYASETVFEFEVLVS